MVVEGGDWGWEAREWREVDEVSDLLIFLLGAGGRVYELIPE